MDLPEIKQYRLESDGRVQNNTESDESYTRTLSWPEFVTKLYKLQCILYWIYDFFLQLTDLI